MESILTPSVDEFLKPYKNAAKLVSVEDGLVLMKAQHKIARDVEFKDWQSFNYFFKKLSNLDVDFNKDDWNYFYLHAGKYIFDINLNVKTLIQNITFDINKENEKNLNEKIDYLIKISSSISVKILGMTELQRKSILAAALLYWNRPYFLKHRYLKNKFNQNSKIPNDLINEHFQRQKYHNINVFQEFQNSPLAKSISDLQNGPLAKSMRDLQNSPLAKSISDLQNGTLAKLAKDFENSPFIKSMRDM